MRLLRALLLGGLLLVPAAAAYAADYEEPDIEFFYPVVTRRPVVERELEFSLEYEKGEEGREVELAASLEWVLLPRWQVEIEFPLVILDPDQGSTKAGLGDIEIDNKVQIFKSVEYRLLVAAGVELKVPSGSESRGTGGELSVEPYLTAGIALGPFDLLAEVAYEWVIDPEREEELSTGLALGYPAWRWFIPFAELRTVTPTRGDDHRAQVYVVPGFDVKPYPGVTLRFGVQLPVTDAKEFDYQVRAAGVWEF
jgi:hypothetical protein